MVARDEVARHMITLDDAVAYALGLPDTELSTSYGQPAVKVASNGRAFLYTGHERDTSFGLALDLDTIEMLKETDPDTYRSEEHTSELQSLMRTTYAVFCLKKTTQTQKY